MKAELNNENNVFNEFEIKLYGVQAYGVTYGEEYNVIVKAARRANGRYYFITREGYEIAWHTLPADQVEHICADMYDQHDHDQAAARDNYDHIKKAGAALVRAELMNDVYELADAEGVAVFLLTSGTDERGHVLYMCSLGTTADEGREIAARRRADQMTTNEAETITTTNETPAADVPAEYMENEAEKIARYMMENAAPVVAEIVNGAFVYHVGHLLPYNLSESTAERVSLFLDDRATMAARALEMGGPSDYFEAEERNALAALERFAAADRAARETAENDRESDESTAAPAADQMTTADAPTASKMARAAAKVVKSATAAALVVLTFATSPAAAADQMTTYHTTDTAEAVGVLAQLTAEGLPLYHVTIKKSATR